MVIAVVAFSCSNDADKDNNTQDSLEVVKSVYPETGNFYSNDNGEALIVANPIIYDVIVKNPNPSDEWADFCLQNADIEAIQNIIFTAVYQGRLTPYHYRMDTILSIEDVKKLEDEVNGEPVGKLQFEEQWFFDEENMEMFKKVSYIVFGYELVNEMGEIYGYKPGFKVYLDKTHNEVTK